MYMYTCIYANQLLYMYTYKYVHVYTYMYAFVNIYIRTHVEIIHLSNMHRRQRCATYD